jgi:hypothetical protein
MKLPNFLVIGAAKSGTTSLYHYLNQHPQIYMSPLREPKFFQFASGYKPSHFKGPRDQEANAHVITNLKAYADLFNNSSTQLVLGESSPSYIYYENVPEKIKEILPDVKIMGILRHPVERAYSNYLHLFASGREPCWTFEEALEAESRRIEQNWEYFWHYKNQGFYYQHLKRYFELFDQTQIRIYLYEDYLKNPVEVLKDMFNFLGVDQTFLPNISTKYNTTTFIKSKWLFKSWQILSNNELTQSALKPLLCSHSQLHYLYFSVRDSLINKLETKEKPQLSLETTKDLLDTYRTDIINLENLIQKDLSHWLDVSKIVG